MQVDKDGLLSGAQGQAADVVTSAAGPHRDLHDHALALVDEERLAKGWVKVERTERVRERPVLRTGIGESVCESFVVCVRTVGHSDLPLEDRTLVDSFANNGRLEERKVKRLRRSRHKARGVPPQMRHDILNNEQRFCSRWRKTVLIHGQDCAAILHHPSSDERLGSTAVKEREVGDEALGVKVVCDVFEVQRPLRQELEERVVSGSFLLEENKVGILAGHCCSSAVLLAEKKVDVNEQTKK